MRALPSFDPTTFSSEVDVVHELEQHLSLYEAPEQCEWLSISSFPGYLLTALDTCRANVVSVKVPTRSTTIVCAIQNGLRRFYDDSDIQELIELKRNFHKNVGRAVESESVEMAAEFFRHFPLGLPGTLSKTRRINLPTAPSIKRQVAERATELGISNGAMAVLCVMVTISAQTIVHPKHAALAGDTITSFLRGVRLRRRIAEVFLEEIA